MRKNRIAWPAKNPDARGFPSIDANWSDPTGTAPYVSSVRARRLASAIARGDVSLLPHLVRAARSIFLAPEVHILGNHLIENGIGLVAASALTHGAEAHS
jgi:hypothetical protein